VSLVGPGGVGKTRLAIRAARDLARGFRDGAWLVELADVRDPALAGNAVMAALDLRDQAAAEPVALLLDHLRDKDLLLVIDNCEHLLGAVAGLVTEIITSSPDVRVIATSREPLSVQGEHVVPVAPLELPAAQAGEPLQKLGQNESVRLFVERAAAASGHFDLTAANRAAVADVCRRLDGLPLAIELAAVRTRVLSVEEIVGRLADRFGLLTGGGRAALPRHQTLETAIEWSHDLLSPSERALLRRICVFAGRFTLQDVAVVCTGDQVAPSDALELMSSLVDKSLVIKEDARSVACYRLHETMRAYAAAKLRAAGEDEAIGERCTDYYVSTCGAMALPARFRLLEWLGWMELEIDNIRAVLRHSLERADSVRGISLATSLAWYWVTRATTEGVRWLDELLASGPGDPAILPWSHFIRGFLAVLQGDWEAATPALERALEAARQTEDPVQITHVLAMASIASAMAGDRDSASRFLAEAQAASEEAGEVSSTVAVLQARCLNGAFTGDVDAIRVAAAEGARLSSDAGDVYALHMMLLNLGGAAFFSGDFDEAMARYSESLRLAYQVDDRIGQYYLLASIANLAATAGQHRLTAQLLGASETIRVGAGAKPITFLLPVMSHAEDLATAALGAAKYRAEFDSGRRLDRETAVALALGERRGGHGQNPGETAADGPLGRREADVARLVAEGLTNKQIGSRLFISERTVDSHVRSILNKMGFDSRAQIAAWMAAASR
jgi:predicted ATPase/DNA-binding CsgD family transcriptional regulator